MNKEYMPIVCSLHDRLEDAIVKKLKGVITYISGSEVNRIEDRVIDWVNENNEEFAVTESGKRIRLDHIISLFGVEFRSDLSD